MIECEQVFSGWEKYKAFQSQGKNKIDIEEVQHKIPTRSSSRNKSDLLYSLPPQDQIYNAYMLELF